MSTTFRLLASIFTFSLGMTLSTLSTQMGTALFPGGIGMYALIRGTDLAEAYTPG